MYLKKLVINGFKSFAEKTEFTFDHPFTAIVGPNGSGKTNVSDAMRWVMGEQSLKLMRMKKASDAIFAGSQQRGRLGMAQVDLHINNEDGRLDVDYAEVIISRRLTRDGDTQYLVNNNPVRLQDIILLLAQANFGQKSYGVIGQGMITDILNANPQDRKDFFDEATGVKEFQIKRDRSINKLIRTEQHLQQAETLLKEIEPRLGSLQRQVKKLEKRQELEAELKDLQVHYYGSLLNGYAQQLSSYRAQLTEVQNETGEYQTKLSGIEAEIDTIGKEESHSEQYARLQQEYSAIIDQKNSIAREQAVLKGRLEVEHERMGEVDLLWLQRRADELTRRIDTEHTELDRVRESIEHQSKQQSKIEETKLALEGELQKLNTALQVAQVELKALTEVLSVPEITSRLNELFTKQEQFLREILATSSLDQFKHVQAQAKAITKELAELMDDLHKETAEDVHDKEQEITSLQERIASTTELKGKLLNEITELRIAVGAKQEKIQLYETSIRTLQKELDDLQSDVERKQAEANKAKDKSAQLAEIEETTKVLEQQLSVLDSSLAEKKTHLDSFHQAQEAKKQRLLELQTDARRLQMELNQCSNRRQRIEIDIAKIETKVEETNKDIEREVSIETSEAITAYKDIRQDHDQLAVEIDKRKHQLELIGGIDPETIQEYEDTQARFGFLQEQSKDLRSTIDSLEEIIDELDGAIKRQFNKSFKAIAKSFETYFKLLFEGGEAKLDMLTEETTDADSTPAQTVSADGTTEEVPAEELEPEFVSLGKLKKKNRVISGIDIIAQPPGKKLQTVHALSGGEKSMTAIALICAIIDANTPPFVVLDEVEAALDESNSEKFSAIVERLSKKTQFVIISHNRATMRAADVLYGVTMGKAGTSHILSVKMSEAEAMVNA